MFNAAANLGQLLARAPTDDAEYSAAVEKATAELKAIADPSKHSALAFLAAKRLDTPDEASGIVLVGTVKDFKSIGSLYETAVEMPGREPRTVYVVSSDSPQDMFKVGDQAAFLGEVIHDIKAELPRYGGEHSPVIVKGKALPLTQEPAP